MVKKSAEIATEFDCIECNRHIIRIAGGGEPKLCAQCIFLPGWFRDPRLRELLDPDHDGLEAMDRRKAMKVWAKTKEYHEGKFLVVRRDGTSPKWPHFVIGARDPYGPAALRAYAEAVRAMNPEGYDREFADSVFELADDYERYQANHGVGDPEKPPHRKDDPAVIQAMNGKKSTIEVKPD